MPRQQQRQFAAYPKQIPPKPFKQWSAWREHKRAAKRTASPAPQGARTTIEELANLLWPWRVVQYPGKAAMVAHILGVDRSRAYRIMAGTEQPTRQQLKRVEKVARTYAAIMFGVARMLEDRAAAQSKKPAIKRA